MATVLVPGEHTAIIDVSASYQTAQSLAMWSQSVTGYYGAQYPHVDASARACVAHHAAYASKAPQGSAGYEVGAPCPLLWPEDVHSGGFSEAQAVVGWQTNWVVPTIPLQTSRYHVQVGQFTSWLNPIAFTTLAQASESWIAAAESVLPAGQEWRAVSTIAVTSITATATWRVRARSGTASIGCSVYRRTDDGDDPWISPGDAPGPLAATFTPSAIGDTVTVPWDEILTDQAVWAFVANNSDNDLGAAPGATPGSGQEINLANIVADTVTATFTGTVTYADTSIFGVPPLHAAQRRGGTDAHAAHARGADTRQSRLLARGPL